jgi:hypothetical protein
MNPKVKQQIIKDLSNHFTTKMCQIIEDSFVVMRIADLDEEDAVAIVTRNLLGLSAFYVQQTGATKGQFLHTCSKIYDEMSSS